MKQTKEGKSNQQAGKSMQRQSQTKTKDSKTRSHITYCYIY